MYLPFPSRVNYVHAAGAGAVLAGVLLVEGNPLRLCGIVFATVMVATLGFNLGGGLRRPTGAYVLFLSLFSGVLGTIVKAALNEPLLENAPNVEQTLIIYLLGTCATVAAVRASLYFRPRQPFLFGGLNERNSNQVVAGCFALGAGVSLLLTIYSNNENGSTGAIVRQLNEAAPLSVLIGVYQRVKQTNGRSSFSWLVVVSWAYITLLGIFSYSKEAIFYSTFAWILAAAAARLRVSWPQVLIAGGLLAGSAAILVPFSQYGRNYRDYDASVAIELLSHPLDTREKALALAVAEQDSTLHWFRHPEGILDRLNFVAIDGALIAKTDQTGELGLTNIFNYLENIVPHVLRPNKPRVFTGNEYAHELGLLADDDTTTGVSFTPFAEAYHLSGWFGLLLVMPVLQLLLFVVAEWMTGSVDETPWALFYVVLFAHFAAEGAISTIVLILSNVTAALIVTALFMIYIAPLIGSLVIGPGSPLARRRPLRPDPSRATA